MNLSQAAVKNKYVSKALSEIGAYKQKGHKAIKKEFLDRSLKHKGAVVLKQRHVPRLMDAGGKI